MYSTSLEVHIPVSIVGILVVLLTVPGVGVVSATDTELGDNTVSGDAISNHTDCQSAVELSVGVAPQSGGPTAVETDSVYFGGQDPHIARGDNLIIDVSATDSAVCDQSPLANVPGKTLMYASPAVANKNVTHTAAIEINETVSEVGAVSVEYAPSETRPSYTGVLTSEQVTLGADTNSDGIIDISMQNHIRFVSVPEPGMIQLTLDRNATVPADSYLLLQYRDVQNPNITANSAVTVSVAGNRTITEQGTLSYSHSESGMLGYGQSLQFQPAEANASQLLSLRPVETRKSTESMVVILPITDTLPQSTYNLTLAQHHSAISRQSGGTSARDQHQIRIFERSAIIFQNPTTSRDTTSISGYTTLAPGSELNVQLYTESSLIELRTEVNTLRFWEATVVLPRKLKESDQLQVIVYDANRREIGSSRLTPGR